MHSAPHCPLRRPGLMPVGNKSAALLQLEFRSSQVTSLLARPSGGWKAQDTWVPSFRGVGRAISSGQRRTLPDSRGGVTMRSAAPGCLGSFGCLFTVEEQGLGLTAGSSSCFPLHLPLEGIGDIWAGHGPGKAAGPGLLLSGTRGDLRGALK